MKMLLGLGSLHGALFGFGGAQPNPSPMAVGGPEVRLSEKKRMPEQQYWDFSEHPPFVERILDPEDRRSWRSMSLGLVRRRLLGGVLAALVIAGCGTAAASGPATTAWTSKARSLATGRHPSDYRTVAVPAAGLTLSLPRAWHRQYDVTEHTITRLAHLLPRNYSIHYLLAMLRESPATRFLPHESGAKERNLAMTTIQGTKFIAFDTTSHQELDVYMILAPPGTTSIFELQATHPLAPLRGGHISHTRMGGKAALRFDPPTSVKSRYNQLETEFEVLEGRYAIFLDISVEHKTTINTIVGSVRFGHARRSS